MPFVFIHVPKTGGTSLRSDLNFAQRRVVTVDTEEQALAVARRNPQAPMSAMMVGHMPIGAHAYLPGDVDYLTFVRHPIDRVASAYFHVLRTPGHPAHARVQGMPLSAYVKLDSNAMTRQFAAAGLVGAGSDVHWRPEREPLTERHLTAAKQALESCAFIGLFENFNRDFTQLRRRLGLRTWLNIPHERRARNRLSLLELDRADRCAVETANGFDLELYEHARRVVDQRLADEPRAARRA